MAVLLILFCAFAAFIGLVMEAYKKVVRKDSAGLWEIRAVALVLSTASGLVMTFVVDAGALSPMLVDSLWLAVPYTIVVYLLQLPACMKVWKPLLKKWMARRLK